MESECFAEPGLQDKESKRIGMERRPTFINGMKTNTFENMASRASDGKKVHKIDVEDMENLSED